jgi:hypothetical protein
VPKIFNGPIIFYGKKLSAPFDCAACSAFLHKPVFTEIEEKKRLVNEQHVHLKTGSGFGSPVLGLKGCVPAQFGNQCMGRENLQLVPLCAKFWQHTDVRTLSLPKMLFSL